jgi:hypothetical protein
MTKKYYVAAQQTTYLSAVVEVPDDWTVDDIREWYEYNGADGEFNEDYTEWRFDWEWFEEADPNTPADTSFVVIEEETSDG